MTKKHFIKLAETLATVRPLRAQNEAWDQWNETVHEIARMCAAENRNFDHERFVDACREW